MNYLIVEDDPNLRMLWRTILCERGYTVTEATTVAAAEKNLTESAFDAMILDLYLGRENGVSLMRLAEARNPGCKIIIVTGSSQYQRQDLLNMSPLVLSVHWKPVDIEAILATCDQIEAMVEMHGKPVDDDTASLPV